MGMRKVFTLLLVLCLGVGSTTAQRGDRHERYSKMRENRSEFIVKQMDLTEDEAKTVIPLVDEYMKQRFLAYKEYFHTLRDFEKKEVKTEAEYNAIMDLYVKCEKEKVELETKFIADLRKLIPIEKVYKYRNAENCFKKDLVKKGKKSKREDRRNRSASRN